MMNTTKELLGDGLKFGDVSAHRSIVMEAAKNHGLQKQFEFIWAQILVETGHLKKFVSLGNYGNVKYFSGAEWLGTVGYVNYNDDDPKDLFPIFKDWQHGARCMCKLLSGRYAVGNCYTIDEYTDRLKAKGWATSPDYKKLVTQVFYQQNHLEREKKVLENAVVNSATSVAAYIAVALVLFITKYLRIW